MQLRRTKGYRKPEGAVVVARPSKWGNPFPLKGPWITWAAVGLGYHGDEIGRRNAAVALHRAWLTGTPIGRPVTQDGPSLEFGDGSVVSMDDHVRSIALAAAGPITFLPPRVPTLTELRGKDLACWCPLEDDAGNRVPCHADVLLELANRND